MNERSFTLGGNDSKAIARDQKAAEREERIQRQKRKYEEDKKAEEEKQKNAKRDLDVLLGEDSEGEMEATDDVSYLPPVTRKSLAAPPPLHVPRNVLLREGVQEAMTRNKISPHSIVDLWCAIVTESGGNVADYCLNAGHIGEKRNETAISSLEKEKKMWTPPNPSVRL